jgi:hypothetical protein
MEEKKQNEQLSIEQIEQVQQEQTPVKVEVENAELPVIQATELTHASSFGNKDIFEQAQRVAKVLSVSDLVPAQYKGNIANCLIAIDISRRIGASELMVMQNLYIVHGRPAWSSQFLIATLNASGKFSPLRYEEDEKNGGRCRAYAVDLSTGERVDGVWCTMEMATAEKWVSKTGSKWQTMPQLMMRYRAAAFFTRQFAPELSMGIQTHEEVIDITNVQNNPETQWTQQPQ